MDDEVHQGGRHSDHVHPGEDVQQQGHQRSQRTSAELRRHGSDRKSGQRGFRDAAEGLDGILDRWVLKKGL